jgi:hypothetical protein
MGQQAIDNSDSLTANINRLTNSWLELKLAIGESDEEGLMGKTLKGWGIALDYIAEKFKNVDQLAKGAASKGASDMIGFAEKDLRAEIEKQKKAGKSPAEIETSIRAKEKQYQTSWKSQLDNLQKEVSARKEIGLTKDGDSRTAGHVISSLLGTAVDKKFASEKDLYKSDKDFQAAKDSAERLKLGMGGLTGLTDKLVSGLFEKPTAAAAAKTKAQSAGGITLNESKNGATNIVFNIDKFQENVFSNLKTANDIPKDAQEFLDKMKIALQTAINDSSAIALK